MPTESEASAKSKSAPPEHSVLAGHVKRSELLNRFFKLEQEVNRLLDHLDIGYQTSPLGQKLKKLRDDAASLQNCKFANRIVAEALKLNDHRNFIVHAKLTGTAPDECKPGWKFSHAGSKRVKNKVHTPSDLENFGTQAEMLANQFKQLRSQQPTPTAHAATNAKSSAR